VRSNLLSPFTLSMAGVVALGAASCSSIPPPTDQMTVARASVDAANAAGAQGFAPTELRMANDKLTQAQRAVADRDYTTALRLAEEANGDAQLAIAKTQSTKARQAATDAQAAARAWHDGQDRAASPATSGDPQ
jgi:hypothetical protein